MRPRFRPSHFGRRHFHHRMHYPFFRGGRLLGLVGLAALGYTLLDKNRREQQRTYSNGVVDVNPQDYS